MKLPEEIGRYKIERLLGHGGMALVLLAQDPAINRQVAIKILPAQWMLNDEQRQRFHQEAKTIAALEHPAIVPIYDFGEHEGQPFLVMRYMPGGSLRQRLNQPLSLAETSRILTRLAEALDYAHGRGVIHRDLKPDNVLFDDQNLPYLADFGIARLVEATKSLTITGTPAYMSPEQIEGNQQLDGRSDLYALGVMLFEMLTAQAPFQADTPARLMYKHVHDSIPDPRILNQQLPKGCSAIIARAMAKEPANRYATATSIARAIATLLRESVPPSSVPTLLEPQESYSRGRVPHTLLLPVLGSFLLVVFFGGIFLARSLAGRAASTPNAPSGAVIADTETPSFTPTPTLEPTRPTETSSPLIPASAIPTALTTETATVTPPTPTPTALSIPPVEPVEGQVWIRTADGMPMVYVPPGEFVMGSDQIAIDQAYAQCLALFSESACPYRWFSDEAPQHTVSLSGFWMDQTEVTNANYAAFLNAIGNHLEGGVTWLDIEDTDSLIILQNSEFLSRPGFADHPAIEVSYYGANAYCNWVGGRLPTEAQWEYAARGPESRIFPWGNTFDGNRLNYCDVRCQASWRDSNVDDGYERTAPVGSYPAGASWIGILDMAGNVWEWIYDRYTVDYYTQSPTHNPEGPLQGEDRALRSGSWDTIDIYLRAGNRSNDLPEATLDDGGFRCVLEQSS